jgi:hypothetical protein
MPNLHGRGENAARAVLVRAGIATDSTHLSLVYRTGKRPPGVALGTVDSQTPAAGCGSQVATGAHGAARIALVLYDGPAGARLAQIAELATALRRQGADGDLQAVLGAVSAAHLIAILHLRPATVTHPIVVAVNGEKGAPRAVVLTVAMPRFASAYTDELFAGSASARIGARPLTAGRRTSLPVWVKSPVAGSHGLVARPGVSVLLDADAVGAGEVTRTTNARGEAVFSVAARRPGDLYVLATVPDGGGVRYAWGVITVKPTRRVP